MTKPLRWGILSTGNIARNMTEDVLRSANSIVTAVASRSIDKAQAFAQQYQIHSAYGDYQSLCESDDVDVIYIGTPHSEHFSNIKMALQAGKHVLCEKPLTLNYRQASECVALARSAGTFFMEAVWMRFFPIVTEVKRAIAQGQIGEPLNLSASFCIDIPYDTEHRLFNRALGGGALLDLGIYPLSFALFMFGDPVSVKGRAELSKEQVDIVNDVQITFENGAVANLKSATLSSEPQVAVINGTKGKITINERFFCPTSAIIQEFAKSEPELIDTPWSGNGYQFEIAEVEQCIANGLTESAVMPLNATLGTMKIMDELRKQWGVYYDCD